MIRTPAIAVVFDVDRLGRDYAAKAWELFLPSVEPAHLVDTEIRDGDTSETLMDRANHFCIAVAGSEQAVRHVRQVFTVVDLPELLPPDQRFLETERLKGQPLPVRARIDSHGKLVTDRWEQGFHKLCVLCRWPYQPAHLPDDLDPVTTAELERLNEARTTARRMASAAGKSEPVSGGAAPTAKPPETPRGGKGRRWWRFWKP